MPTKEKFFLILLTFSITIQLPLSAQQQFSVSGIIRDSETSEFLAGATFSLKDNGDVSVSDKNGKFEFRFNSMDQKPTLLIKYIGYKTKNILLYKNISVLNIFLEKDIINQHEVEISESRIPMRILESPVTMMKVDSKTISQLPNENFYAGLATQKGVDVESNSLFFKSFNLRGFSSPLNESVLQLVDGMDNIAPGQGFTVGNLAGPIDIDVDNVEIIPGSSTAIYGANSFNGLIYMHTKDPFLHEGLSVQLKNGYTLLNDAYHEPSVFTDYQVRYAKVFKRRFALKVNIGYLNGTDWQQESLTDFDQNNPLELRGLNNPGRDIANIFGDEVQQGLPIGVNGSDVYVSRTGFDANEILGTTTTDTKISSELHFKPTNTTDLSYQFNYSLFNSNVGFTNWNFRNFSIVNHKLEWKGENFFVRAYSIRDHDGNSFDARGTAIDINNKWKPDSIWFDEFTHAYNGDIAGVNAHDYQTARAYADLGTPLPGSELFNQLYNEFTTRYSGPDIRGDRFADESGLYKALAQYDFSKVIHGIDIICGVDFGSRYLSSHGTMFIDTIGGKPIYSQNYSGYVQVKKELFNERLSVLASLRIDKFTNTETEITPRLALVLKLNSKNFLRASYQNGIRPPDPFDQYSYWHWDIYTGIGALESNFEKYNLVNSSFDYFSYVAFTDSAHAYLDEHGQAFADTAAELYKHILKKNPLKQIKPEKINSFEIGYQSLLFKNKLHTDVAFFISRYDHMIMGWLTMQPKEGNNYDSLQQAAVSFINDDLNIYFSSINYTKRIYSGGIEMSLAYNFFKNFVISGNATFTKSTFKVDSSTYGWMIDPPFRSNVSLSNTNWPKNIGFNINWRWTNSIGTFFADATPNVNNKVNANNVIDAQVSYTLSKLNSVLRIGTSNLLNHYYSDEANGASIGGAYYFSIMYNVK